MGRLRDKCQCGKPKGADAKFCRHCHIKQVNKSTRFGTNTVAKPKHRIRTKLEAPEGFYFPVNTDPLF